MKSSAKKILTVICSLFLSVFMFAGCNLIEVNKAKYYSQTVVSVELQDGYGEDYNVYLEKYSKKDLLTAYYNYAYSYVSKGQISTKDGVDYALNNMVNLDLLYKYVKQNYFDNPSCNLEFTDEDRNDVKLEVYDAIQEQITTLEDEIYEEWEIDHTKQDDLSSEEKSSLRKKYEPYTSKVELQTINGKEEIVLSPSQLVKTHDPRVAGDKFVQKINNPEVSKEAYTRYIKSLQDSAKSEGTSTKESVVFENELNRLTKIYTRTKYLSLFETWYNINHNFTYDTTNKVYILNDEIKNQVVAYYKERFISQKNIYDNNESAYHTAMAGDSTDEIYYHYNSGNEYMYVSHILMKFSDAQKAQITELKKKLEKNAITQKTYDALVQDIANRTVVTYEEDGEKRTSNALEVTKAIKQYVNAVSYENKEGEDLETALNERAKLFNDMIYKYNDDEGIMNKDFAYVVNLDTEVSDKMVKEFADTARELNEKQSEGAMSDMVITEYGVHILYHAGLVKNVVKDIDTLTAFDLIKKHTQRSSNKTLFAKIYDTVVSENYQKASNGFVSDCYNFVKIVKYEKRYKDLTK